MKVVKKSDATNMKSFFVILAGNFLASILYVSVTYSLFPPDPAFHLSFLDNVSIFFVISLLATIVFFSLYKFFKVQEERFLILASASFLMQIAAYVASYTLLEDFGTLGLAFSVLILSAVATFLLDKLKTRDHQLS